MSIFKSPKILQHPDRLQPYLGSRDVCNTVPITMEMDLTNACQHQCPRCVGMRQPSSPLESRYVGIGDGHEIPIERAVDYIVQMANCGVRGLIFTGGGEPAIHRYLASLMFLAKSCGMDVGLITNGGLLHRHPMKPIVPLCSWIRISIDAGTPEGYRRTHGMGALEWNKVWANILAITSYRGGSNVTIGVGFLADAENIDELPILADLCDRVGVDYLQVRPFYSTIGFDPRKQIAAVKSNQYERLRIVASDQKYDLLNVNERTYTKCHIAQFASVICADAKMYLCCHFRGIPEFCLGDLKKNSFSEILNSERRREVIEKVCVNECQELCRGDQVNRHVETLLRGGTLDTSNPAEHVNFL